jgi:TATA-box binding protein (TBP) (component of TFIID and TFIIIB)
MSTIKINKEYNLEDLPEGLKISVMCASFKLNVNINTDNIYEYMELDKNYILTIKKSPKEIKTLIPKKKKRKSTLQDKKTKDNRSFYNQITIVMRINDNDEVSIDELREERAINCKLFKNGSIQMSGCKSLIDIKKVLEKLTLTLMKKRGKIVNGMIEEIKFVEKKEMIEYKFQNADLNGIGIFDFKIDMINSGYNCNLHINREKLYQNLLNKNITCRYEPVQHAGLCLKYKAGNKKDISIFIFEKGKIIITGAKNRNNILNAFEYVTTILKDNATDIKKISVENFILNSKFSHLLKF